MEKKGKKQTNDKSVRRYKAARNILIRDLRSSAGYIIAAVNFSRPLALYLPHTRCKKKST